MMDWGLLKMRNSNDFNTLSALVDADKFVFGMAHD